MRSPRVLIQSWGCWLYLQQVIYYLNIVCPRFLWNAQVLWGKQFQSGVTDHQTGRYDH